MNLLLAASYSQYKIDGLRLSENFYGSTARSLGLAGAMSSIGGDLGSVAINPAGIGVYRTSEFSFSPAYYSLSSSSKYLDQTKPDFKSDLGLGNLGAVFTFNTGNTNDWISFSMALGYNKTNDFSNRYAIEGKTNNTTLGNEFVSYSKGYSIDQLDQYREGLAYNSYVLNPTINNTYYTPYDSAVNINQKHIFNREGSSGNYYVGFGANYDNKLYFGATLNITSNYYIDDITHTESQVNNISYLQNYTYNQTYTTWGKGFNLKIGAIFRPIEQLRVGLTFQTPTLTSVNQQLETHLTSTINSESTTYYPSDNNGNSLAPAQDNFSVTSPLRAILGFAYMFKQYGFISVDYELADYRSINFSEGDYSDAIDNSNKNMNTIFRVTNNLRVGAEVKLNQFYLRGGFAYYQNPIDTKNTNSLSMYYNTDSYIYSGGIGYRTNGFYIDFAYSMLNRGENYYMYIDPNLKPVNLTTSNGTFMATLGFKF